METTPMPHPTPPSASFSIPLPVGALRTVCDPAFLPSQTESLPERWPAGLGQERALKALELGLCIRQPGFNVFVLGESGTGRHVAVEQALMAQASQGQVPPDLCYLHNFDEPLKPFWLHLPAGMGCQLRADMQGFIRDLEPAIDAALSASTHQSRIEALQTLHKEREEKALGALSKVCRKDGLLLLQTPEGFVFAPGKGEKPMEPEAWEALPAKDRERTEARIKKHAESLASLMNTFPGWRKDLHEALIRAEEEALRPVLAHLLGPLRERYATQEGILRFLSGVEQDVLEEGRPWQGPTAEEPESEEEEDPHRFHRYQVKVLVDHSQTQGAPVIREDNPGFGNLVGRIEYLSQMGAQISHFSLIRPGALHRAHGGYLLLDALRLFSQPYAWEGLKRVLRTGEIAIEPPAEAQGWSVQATLEPMPAPCRLKVVLIGERDLYYQLCEQDPDFVELFKIAADFDDDLPRTPENTRSYALLLQSLARRAGLLPVSREGLARLTEEGARLCEDARRLTLNIRPLTDILRESDYYARQTASPQIDLPHLEQSLTARRNRLGRYSERLLEGILEGGTLISTDGERAGQVNGLVVVDLAGEAFGHPVRITATARVGSGDVVDIERETDLGGALHSKGVLILTAFLAARYSRHQPLSLSASLVFEQSYGPVEGDSASLAELCALLSALAQVPISQSLAITGSINQFGEVQAIGGVNEKIEGFFRLCKARGLTGRQGVIIPKACVPTLMLDSDVVSAAEEGLFKVHCVETVNEAMTLLTGLPAGETDAKGRLPKGCLNERVACALAEMSAIVHQGSDSKARHRAREHRH
jgi:predicted ATP-dependent protease